MRRVNAVGMALLRRREGCRLRAYRDEGGVWTIGWGHTGPEVREGLCISQGEADAHLQEDVAKHAAIVERCVRVPLTDNQFAALVCLAYNIGPTAFRESTLLRLLNGDPARGVRPDYLAAANHFLDWKYCGHKLSGNLLERRKLERELFLAGTEPPPRVS
jgi:lysozyme